MPNSADLPLLKQSATVARQNGVVVIRHLRDEITLQGAAARLLSEVAPQLDGRTPIDKIAEKTSEKPARLRALVEQLEKTGVLAFLSTKDDGALLSGTDFYDFGDSVLKLQTATGATQKSAMP